MDDRELDQRLNEIREFVIANWVKLHPEEAKKLKQQQKQPEVQENPEPEGYDQEGVPELKSDPEQFVPKPLDDEIVDEEEEMQEFYNMEQQANQVKRAEPPKKKNIFVTED